MSRLATLAVLLLSFPAYGQGDFPDITGTWTGSYDVGFAASNSNHEQGPLPSEMELEVTKVEGNLVTATRRWRRVGASEWVVVDIVGTFQLDDRTRFILSELSASDPDGSVGILFGTYVEDVILISFAGLGTGAAFSAELKKQSD